MLCVLCQQAREPTFGSTGTLTEWNTGTVGHTASKELHTESFLVHIQFLAQRPATNWMCCSIL